MDDNTCITIAVLHGMQTIGSVLVYFAGRDLDGSLRKMHKANQAATDMNGFPSRAAAARAYCKHFNLEG